MNLKTIIAIYLAFIGLIAFSAESAPVKEKSLKEKMALLDKETKALIGPASCSSDNQCHSLGFTHKPCGGFSSYRIYSDKNTDVAQLKSKVKQYNALSKEWNKKNNLISDCMLLVQPTLACKVKTCQIK